MQKQLTFLRTLPILTFFLVIALWTGMMGRVAVADEPTAEDLVNSVIYSVAEHNSDLAELLYAFAEKDGVSPDGETIDFFRRLDARSPERQAQIARRMSPRFTNTIIESAHFGIVGLHRGFGRRTEMDRVDKRSVSDCGSFSCAHCAAPGTSGWIDGFGTDFDRKASAGVGAADGEFNGTSFGFQRGERGRIFGVFGSWARHQVDGDGHGKGDWGHVGLFGRVDRRYGFWEGSIAYGFGDYKIKRNLFVPGIDAGSQTDSLDSLFYRAESSPDTQAFSLRLAGGEDFWVVHGWTVGPRAELSLSYVDLDGTTERGAESLNLYVDRYKTTYLEGGIGLHAAKNFFLGRHHFVAMGKIMGMYGGTMGGDLFARFSDQGERIRIHSKHMSSAWCVPEATLAWNPAPGVVISGSYFGRFGEKYDENAGSLSLNLFW